MSKYQNATLAVTGASGHLGRAVIDDLLAQGATKIVAISRDPAKLTGLPSSVEARHGDFNDPASLAKAFAGVERLLIISTDAVDGVGTRARQQRDAVAAAVAAGVKHLAYTSLTGAYPDPTNPIADSHFWTETAIAASPLSFSILRNNQYADYIIPGAQQAIASGTLYHAGAAGRRAYVTRADCAAAAAAALLNADGRRIFDIGGDEALSGDDLAALFTAQSGRPVTALTVPAEGFIAGLTQAGIPVEMAHVLARFDTDTAKGYLAITAGHFTELTGRAPESVEAFLARTLKAMAA